MKKVVSFSGGRTSAYLCHLMIEKFGRENVDFVFMDTGAEHPKTYEFIRKVDEHLCLNLAWIRTMYSEELGGGSGFEIVVPKKFSIKEPVASIKSLILSWCNRNAKSDVGFNLKSFKNMINKYGVPYIGGMFCNDRMKLVPYKKYCDFVYGKGGYETWLGIRHDEPKRILGESVHKILSISGIEEDDDLIGLYCHIKGGSDFDYFDGMFSSNHVSYNYQELIDLISERVKKNSGIRYMAEISKSEKKDVIDWWEQQPFDLEIPEWLGNCVFCPKKSNLKLAAAQRDEPELYHEFLTMLYGDEVRHDKKTGHWSQMYRGKKSLEQVIGMFDGSTGDEIKARIRGSKSIETGSCSESCEVFVCEANQIDMFS